MRTIRKLIVHCSATQNLHSIGWDDFHRWHVKENGWDGIGYHFMILTDGAIIKGRPVEEAGAHARGHNADSIGICLVGGIDANGRSEANPTPGQLISLRRLVEEQSVLHPEAVLMGHGDIEGANKDCPCFSVTQWALTGAIVPVRGAA